MDVHTFGEHDHTGHWTQIRSSWPYDASSIAEEKYVKFVRITVLILLGSTPSSRRQYNNEMDQEKINDFLLRNSVDWIGWDFNTPTASHMDGVWERQIRSCRSILTSFLKNHSQSLNDESFITVLTEVETIVNSRLLTVEALSDSNSLAPLTPIQLLTSKSKIVMAPPGK